MRRKKSRTFALDDVMLTKGYNFLFYYLSILSVTDAKKRLIFDGIKKKKELDTHESGDVHDFIDSYLTSIISTLLESQGLYLLFSKPPSYFMKNITLRINFK